MSLSKAIAAVHVYISIRWVTSSERNRAILNSVMVEGSEVCSRSSQAGSLASSFERLCKFPTTPWLNESMVNRNSHTDWLLSCHKVGAVNRPLLLLLLRTCYGVNQIATKPAACNHQSDELCCANDAPFFAQLLFSNSRLMALRAWLHVCYIVLHEIWIITGAKSFEIVVFWN